MRSIGLFTCDASESSAGRGIVCESEEGIAYEAFKRRYQKMNESVA